MIKLISGQFCMNKENSLSFVETLSNESSAARVVFVLEIEEAKAKHTLHTIKKIFQEHFFQEEKDLLLRFENCMKKVNNFLKDNTPDIQGLIAVQEKTELHVSQAGEAEAYLIRRGKLNVIIENMNAPAEQTDEVFTSIASGELLIDDRIVFSSLRLLRYATASQVISVLSEGISEGMDSLKELLEIETSGAAVICLHARGASVFSHTEKPSIKIPRSIRSSFLKKLAQSFEISVKHISQKTGHNYDKVQNGLFAAIGVFIAILLIWGVSSASTNNERSDAYESYKVQMLKIEKELQTAETRSLMNDISSSNAILNKVETSVQEMLQQGIFTDEGLAILARVQKQRDAANKITRIQNMNERVLVDISSVSETEELKGFNVLNDQTFIYSKNTLYKTILDNIEPGILVNQDSEIIKSEAMNDRDTIVFTLSSGQYSKFSEGVVSSATTSDEAGFKNNASYKMYNRFMYLLSPEENQIWKYEKKREGFTSPSPWITEATDLSTAIDFAIDGSIYALKAGGGVSLFYKGKEVSLSIEGGDENLLTDATKIFVETNMTHVYFLNPVKNSVISFFIDKNSLKYSQEYVFETEQRINDFYIDSNEQRMLITDNKKLYEITL
jgi:hypothetical protein